MRHYSKPSAVVLTFCPILGREISDTEDAIKQLKATLAPVRIHNRVAYSRAQQTGLTAQEFEPDGSSRGNQTTIRLYVYAPIRRYRRGRPWPAIRCNPFVQNTGECSAARSLNPEPRRRAPPKQAAARGEEAASEKFYRPSRDGQKLIAGHFAPKVAKQLKLLAVEEDTTVQALLEQALDLLFVKKGKERVSGV